MSAIDDIEEHLTEMRASLSSAIVDPFYYAHYNEQIRGALRSLTNLKAQQAPATLPPPKRTPTRKAPVPIVLAPGKRGTVKPKGA